MCVSLTGRVRRAGTWEAAFLLSSNNADRGKFSLIFVISSGEGEERPSQAKIRTPRKGGEGKRVEVGPGVAFSVHHQEFLDFESGAGQWWPLVTQDREGAQSSSQALSARCS